MEKNNNNSENLSIPKRSVWSFLGLILSLAFTYVQVKYYLLIKLSEILFLKEKTLSDCIELMWIYLITYTLVVGNIYLIINIFRKGKFRWSGNFFSSLSKCFSVGVIIGLFFGLIFTLDEGFNEGLIAGLFWGFLSSVAIFIWDLLPE